MATTRLSNSLRADVEAALPSIWVVAVLTALVSAIPVAMVRDSAPNLIGYPILIGAVICTCIAIYQKRLTARKPVSSSPLETFGGEFANFAGLRDLAVVELTIRDQKGKQHADLQLELGFALEQRPPSVEKFRIFRTPDGKQLIALDCERFSAMLTSEALESFDRTFERSLEATVIRFAGSSIPREHLFALTDEMAKDILKSDIRGNLAAYLAKTNDHLMKRVIDELRRASGSKSGTRSIQRATKSATTG